MKTSLHGHVSFGLFLVLSLLLFLEVVELSLMKGNKTSFMINLKTDFSARIAECSPVGPFTSYSLTVGYCSLRHLHVKKDRGNNI